MKLSFRIVHFYKQTPFQCKNRQQSRAKMIRQSRQKYNRIQQQKSFGIVKWLEKELLLSSSDFSTPSYQLVIQKSYRKSGIFLIINIHIKPLIGTFKNIQFSPILLFNITCSHQRPIIYNNKRIFHPNIDIYTCEIVSKNIVNDWNPTSNFHDYLLYIPKVIVEPDCNFVPNNPLNIKSTFHFIYNSHSFLQLFQKYSSDRLDQTVSDEFQSNLCIESQEEEISYEIKRGKVQAYDFWDINFIKKQDKALPSVKNQMEAEEEQGNLVLLTRRLTINELTNEIRI